MELPRLNIPSSHLRTEMREGIIKVYDPLRQKWVPLTPEEHVRQQFTAWMQSAFHYPPALMANEIGIEVNGTRKRCDTVVFDRTGAPMMIVEFKAPEVKISQQTFDQIVRYNLTLRARLLVVSNGVNHYCCVVDYQNNSYRFLPQIPDFRDIVNPDSFTG